MTVISTDNAEHYLWGDRCDGWHLAKSKNLSVIQERVPAGGTEVRHYHKCAEQFFYVLAGEANIEIDSVENKLVTGQGIHIPSGLPHRLRNDGQADLHFIVISTPPSHGDRVLA